MKTHKKGYKIQLVSKMLGTVPKNKEVYATYIATKDTENEEVETVQEVEEKGWTGFHVDDDGLFIYGYMILGFLKSSIQVMMENKAVKKIPAYKKWLDRLVFIRPRRLYFGKDKPDGILERSIRTMTPKGPRVSVVRSDYMDEGTTIEFEIEIIKNSKGIDFALMDKLFEYGEYQGLGQWRGSGRYGQFRII